MKNRNLQSEFCM